MSQETFIVGNREFTCMRMNAFAANKILLKLQKVLLPIIGVLAGGKTLGDMNVAEAGRMIAENIDDSVMDNIVLPMFAEAKVFCVEKKKFIKSAVDIDQCFTSEELFDFYELIFEVGRFQFGPFFSRAMARFGSQAEEPKTANSPAS